MAQGTKNKYGLTPKQEVFCLEYFKTGIASQSYKKAFPNSKKWSDSALYSRASNFLKNDKVKARLEALEAEREKSVQKNVVLNKTKILEELVNLFEETKKSGAGERMTSLQAIKLMAQISKLLDNSNQNNIQVNIQNNQTVGEVTDYLDL